MNTLPNSEKELHDEIIKSLKQYIKIDEENDDFNARLSFIESSVLLSLNLMPNKEESFYRQELLKFIRIPFPFYEREDYPFNISLEKAYQLCKMNKPNIIDYGNYKQRNVLFFAQQYLLFLIQMGMTESVVYEKESKTDIENKLVNAFDYFIDNAKTNYFNTPIANDIPHNFDDFCLQVKQIFESFNKLSKELIDENVPRKIKPSKEEMCLITLEIANFVQKEKPLENDQTYLKSKFRSKAESIIKQIIPQYINPLAHINRDIKPNQFYFMSSARNYMAIAERQEEFSFTEEDILRGTLILSGSKFENDTFVFPSEYVISRIVRNALTLRFGFNKDLGTYELPLKYKSYKHLFFLLIDLQFYLNFGDSGDQQEISQNEFLKAEFPFFEQYLDFIDSAILDSAGKDNDFNRSRFKLFLNYYDILKAIKIH